MSRLAEISVVFVDNFARLSNVINVANDLPFLRLIVHFDNFDDSQLSSLNIPPNIELISFSALMVSSI